MFSNLLRTTPRKRICVTATQGHSNSMNQTDRIKELYNRELQSSSLDNRRRRPARGLVKGWAKKKKALESSTQQILI